MFQQDRELRPEEMDGKTFLIMFIVTESCFMLNTKHWSAQNKS